MPLLPSYKNQSIDLHSKSIDWFLYESNTGTQWVNHYESPFQRAWKDSLKRVLEAYSETCQTLRGSVFSIFAKSSILDICQGSEYASVLWKKTSTISFSISLQDWVHFFTSLWNVLIVKLEHTPNPFLGFLRMAICMHLFAEMTSYISKELLGGSKKCPYHLSSCKTGLRES